MKITIPISWNDLSLRQCLAAYAIIMRDNSAILTPQEDIHFKRIELFNLLANIKIDRILTIAQLSSRSSELVNILQHTNFLFDIQDNAYTIATTLTRNHYPTLELTDGTTTQLFHAPSDGLDNLTIYELGYVFQYIEAYIKTNDPQLVPKLLATIYRPAKEATPYNLQSGYEGDIRQPLMKHESMIDKRLPYFQQLAPIVQQLQLLWLLSCTKTIVNSYPKAFPDAQDFGTKSGNDYGIAALLLSLANGIVHLEAVSNQSFHNALTYISYMEDQRQAEELRSLSK